MASHRSPLLVVFLTVLLDLIGFGIIIPLLPFYALTLGAGGLEIGLLAASYSLMQFLFAPLWGRLSDRVGRRPVLLVSIAGNAVAMALYAASSSFTLLLIARSFAGAFAANIATAQAYVADVTDAQNRARGMGMIGAAFGLGFVLGPVMGGLLSSWFGAPGAPAYGAPGYFAAGLGAVNLVLAFALLREPERHRALVRRFGWGDLRRVLGSRSTGIPILVFFLAVTGFANLEATYALFTEWRFGYNGEDNGYLFFYIGLIMVVIQGGLIGRLVARFGERLLVWAGMAVGTLALFAFPSTSALWMLLLVSAGLAVGNGIRNPALSALLSKAAGEDEQGTVLGISQGMGSLARVFGPLIGGAMWDLSRPSGPYVAGGLIMAAGLLVALGLPAGQGAPKGDAAPGSSP